MSSKDDKPHDKGLVQDNGLRIAWQYQKYLGEAHGRLDNRDAKHEYNIDYDWRKPLERQFLSGKLVDCISTDGSTIGALRERCSTFFAQNSRGDGGNSCGGRIAIQSFCAPQCEYYGKDWDMLSFIKYLRAMARSSNAVVRITFPHSLLSESFSKRWQHMADTLLSVKAMLDEDKEVEKLLTGYNEMVGLLNVHKVARVNTQGVRANSCAPRLIPRTLTRRPPSTSGKALIEVNRRDRHEF